MHREAYRWTEKLLLRYPEIEFKGADIIEFGAYNVNGTIRPLFPVGKQGSYTGVDVREGTNVDAVGDARYFGDDGAYNIVVSCEMLEHCPLPALFFRNAYRILRPGGHLILTCASEKRAPHTNDGEHGDLGGEYYGGVTADELRAWAAPRFTFVLVEENERAGDVYLYARKGVEMDARDDEVAE